MGFTEVAKASRKAGTMVLASIFKGGIVVL